MTNELLIMVDEIQDNFNRQYTELQNSIKLLQKQVYMLKEHIKILNYVLNEGKQYDR